jgi:hypothetical protein
LCFFIISILIRDSRIANILNVLFYLKKTPTIFGAVCSKEARLILNPPASSKRLMRKRLQAPGFRHQASGARLQASGARLQASGNRRQEDKLKSRRIF